MADSKPVPDIVIGRLPVYLQALTHSLEQGERIIASQQLACRLGISSAQIRKDLSHFGEFGKQGMGYDIAYLRDELEKILKVDREWEMALVGAGDLGQAIVGYGFQGTGFRIACVFDNDPQKFGRTLGQLEIYDVAALPERVKALGLRIAIVAVPASEAQATVNRLVEAGIRAILNYAPITVTAPAEVKVQSIDPIIHLQHMTYYL